MCRVHFGHPGVNEVGVAHTPSRTWKTRGAEPAGSAPSTHLSGPLAYSSPLKSATASSRPLFTLHSIVLTLHHVLHFLVYLEVFLADLQHIYDLNHVE